MRLGNNRQKEEIMIWNSRIKLHFLTKYFQNSEKIYNKFTQKSFWNQKTCLWLDQAIWKHWRCRKTQKITRNKIQTLRKHKFLKPASCYLNIMYFHFNFIYTNSAKIILKGWISSIGPPLKIIRIYYSANVIQKEKIRQNRIHPSQNFLWIRILPNKKTPPATYYKYTFLCIKKNWITPLNDEKNF